MSASLPYIGAAEVHAALPFTVLTNALRKAFAGDASVPLRHAHTVRDEDGARLLLMPAWGEGDALGVKLVTVFPGNRERGMRTVSALYAVFDGSNGHPRALLDGEALTLRRTASASALASSYLSRPESSTLLVVGTGALAPYMARAHCSARQIKRVLVWGRRTAAASVLARSLSDEGLPAEAVDDLGRASGAADIITCATTSREPLLFAAQVRPGTHVDLVGAFTPQMREADDTLVSMASVFVDTRDGALAEAGDLVQAIASGAFSRDRVRADLSDLCTGRHPGRMSEVEVTLFKSVGTALEDLCAAVLVVGGYAAGVPRET